MIRSAVIIGHNRQARTRRSAGSYDGISVQSVQVEEPPAAPDGRPPASHPTKSPTLRCSRLMAPDSRRRKNDKFRKVTDQRQLSPTHPGRTNICLYISSNSHNSLRFRPPLFLVMLLGASVRRASPCCPLRGSGPGEDRG